MDSCNACFACSTRPNWPSAAARYRYATNLSGRNLISRAPYRQGFRAEPAAQDVGASTAADCHPDAQACADAAVTASQSAAAGPNAVAARRPVVVHRHRGGNGSDQDKHETSEALKLL